LAQLPDNLPLLYLISNRQAFRRNPEIDDSRAQQIQIEAIANAALAGCRLIQVREKDMSDQALTEFTRRIISVARPHGAKVLVNERIEAALAADADGLHLPAASIKPREILEIKGMKDCLIGASTHSLAEARKAQSCGADFIVCGPLFETASKRVYGPPLGIERFHEICREVSLPVLAIGGITIANYREPLLNGAAGIAAIGLFTEQANLKEKVEKIFSFFAQIGK
jgi:thiamine-phosphate pyrophosphorylase